MQSWCSILLLNGSRRTRAKTKLHKKPREACKSFWNPRRKPKVIYTDNSLEFGKACEDLSLNHCTSTPHRSETNGIAERAVRIAKEGTSAVLLQSGLNESWWADSMECYTYLRNVTDLLSETKLRKKPREACKSSWNPRGNQKSFTLTIPWNSERLVKIFHGIIARPHHTHRRLMVLLKEQCA